mmetsp:Transcript_6338/g.9848  ORF Transcript_6338/g.9848 Transcript_6338/m.9848 type:complete len:510 (-) Transcript_6338:80-1609(-)
MIIIKRLLKNRVATNTSSSTQSVCHRYLRQTVVEARTKQAMLFSTSSFSRRSRPTPSKKKATPNREWKTIDEVWNNSSVIEDFHKPSGFETLEEMLEYGKLKKELHKQCIEENLPPPEQVPELFELAKQDVRSAVELADNEILEIPNSEKAVQDMRGEEYPLDDLASKKEDDSRDNRQNNDREKDTRATQLATKLGRLLPIQVDIETRMFNKIIPGGRKMSYGYFFVAGNGKGYAGWGYGKAPGPEGVRDRANVNLLKNLMFVPLYQGRTIYDKEIRAKFQGTRMIMWRRPEMHGVTAAPVVDLVLKCFGITDVTVKIIGPRTRTTVIKCLFKLLSQVTCHTTNYKARGKAVYDPTDTQYEVLTYTKMKEQQLRVKKVIAEIPRKYGVPMMKIPGTMKEDNAYIVPPTVEEMEHLESMEEKFIADEKAEQEQYIARMRKMGFEIDEEYEKAKLNAAFNDGTTEMDEEELLKEYAEDFEEEDHELMGPDEKDGYSTQDVDELFPEDDGKD